MTPTARKLDFSGQNFAFSAHVKTTKFVESVSKSDNGRTHTDTHSGELQLMDECSAE